MLSVHSVCKYLKATSGWVVINLRNILMLLAKVWAQGQLQSAVQHLKPLSIQHLAQGHISETEVRTHLEDRLSNDPTSPQDIDLYIICFRNLMSNVMRPNGCYSWAVSYLASSIRGVSAHFVVRVVVTALESAPPDTAESSDSSSEHRSHILELKPVRRVLDLQHWFKDS